jgi:hypothetical protein
MTTTKTTEQFSKGIRRTVSDVFYKGDGHTETNVTETVTSVRTSQKRVTSDVTVNYYTRLRSGAILPDLSHSIREWVLKPGVIRTTSRQTTPLTVIVTTTTNAPYTYANGLAGTPIVGRDAQLRMKLLRKMRDSEFNAPVAIAEAGKAIDMVTSRANDLVTLIRAAKRGDIVTIARLVKNQPGGNLQGVVKRYHKDFGVRPDKAAANLWLELQYGWKPLLADCRNAVETVMDTVDRDIDRCGTVRASLPNAMVQSETDGITIGSLKLKEYKTVRDSRRGVWLFRPKTGYYPAKFGVLNPMTVAWELLPFSFVADWFLPIGDYLASFDTRFRVDHVGGTYGSRVQTDSTRVVTGWINGSNLTSASGLATSRYVVTERTKMTSIPDLSLSDVQLDPELNVSRLFSAVSLLRQNLRF